MENPRSWLRKHTELKYKRMIVMAKLINIWKVKIKIIITYLSRVKPIAYHKKETYSS